MLLPCAGSCGGPTPHHRTAAVGDELLIDTCLRCSVERQQPLRHHPRWPRHTACALPLGPKRAVAPEPAAVTCPDCAQALIDEARAPTPDWRPDLPLAEDFYGR